MKDITEIMQRGDCFKLLAACFYEPDKQLFTQEHLGEKLVQLFDELVPGSKSTVQHIGIALNKLDQQTLSIDHAELFVGPFELIAAPYGSVYMEGRRTVMGESTINVAQYYQEAGLSVDIKEPPDHIAIELEFMYFLCSKEATAISEGQLDESNHYRELQKLFFLSALQPWVGRFCEKIRGGTDNEFYLSIANCLDSFLSSCDDVYTKAQAVTTG